MKTNYLKTWLTMLMLVFGMGVTWGEDTKTEGFEAATTDTNYQSTVNVNASKSDCGIAWTIYYGNVTTSSAITGNSVGLRLYTSNNYGYLESKTPVENLSSISFDAKAATSNSAKIKFNVQTSTDGSSWTNVATDVAPGTTSSTYEYSVTSGHKFVKVSISSNSTKPSKSNAQLTIDNFKFTYSTGGGSNGPTLQSLAVSGTPTKTTYTEGDKFDPAGLTVTGTYDDSSTETITSGITWSEPAALTADQTSVDITATVSGITSNAYTVTGLTVNAIPEKTIAEFIASEGGKCYLTGVVSNIGNTTYGNFDLTDASGTIYVYGCLNAAGESKKFAELDVVAGDKIKVLANEYEVFNEKHEAKNVIFVEELQIEKAKYTVSIITPENGLLVVKNGDTVINSGAEVEEGKTLTIECTPTDAETYRLKNWEYKEEGADWVSATTTTLTVTKNVEFRATFELIPVYTIAWNVNGEEFKSENLKEGAEVTAPEVSSVNDKEFRGWVTSTIEGTTNDVPEFVTPSTTADANATYYAVFAKKESEGSNGSIELTNDNIGSIYDNKSTSYRTGEIGDWAFKGAINKTSTTYYVQMNRETNNTKNAYNSHLSTPTCPAPIKSVVINTTNSTASERTFILTNSSEVGAAATDADGVYGYGSLTKEAGSVTINVTGDPTSLHIYPHGGAVYVSSVTINYESSPSYSGYCTTVIAEPTYTEIADGIQFVAHNTAGYWATYSIDKDVFIATADVYTVSVDNETITMNIVNKEQVATLNNVSGTFVPANTGVLLFVENATEAPSVAAWTVANKTIPALDSDNMLYPSSKSMYDVNAAYYFKLAYDNYDTQSGLGFYWGEQYGGAFTCKAGAYLAVPSGVNARSFYLFDDSETTGIDNVNANLNANGAAFNLAGQRVATSQKGIMIINGKKVIK